MSKKLIAIISALAMVVTLLAPVGVQPASAASDNSVDRVVTVSDDTYIGENPGDIVPNLIIENDDNFAWEDEQVFRLVLPSDADWKVDTSTTINVENSTATARVSRVLTDQIIEITLDADTTASGNDFGTNARIEIPLYVELDGVDGEVRVTVDARDSRVTSGSYTFAVAQSGGTVATVASKKTVNRGNNEAGANIIIDETTASALSSGDTHGFTLRLPNDFEWSTNTTIELPANVTSNQVNTTTGAITVGAIDERDLTIEFTGTNDSVRESIVINPVFEVTRDASFGEIEVDIIRTKGDVSAQSGLLIAEYKDYGVNIEVEEVKQIVAGYDDDEDEFKTATITIKETIANSFSNGRVIDFELPSWVRVATGQSITIDNDTTGGKSTITIGEDELNKNRNEFELEISGTDGLRGNGSSKIEFEFEIPLTIEGTKTGEIELIVSGAGIETQEVVIAEAIAPVTAEVNVADVRLGVQNQAAPDIIITENVAGAIREGSLDLAFADGVARAFSFNGATFEVIEGDLKLDDDGHSKTGQDLNIAIDSESSEPSTIKVSGVEITVDRTAPEGLIKLDVKGDALVNNNGGPGDFASRIARFDFANVITPASGDVRGTSVFTIDSMNYTVIESGQEVERTMDVAPYIKDDRTFLPVFFVAQSLGVSESNIVWEPHTKTVTIMKGDRIASMQIGNKVLTVNGTPIQMDTAPEIKDGRTMLPVFFVGQALGASVEWDGDTRQVTVNQ